MSATQLRKKLIQEIATDFHAMKNEMHARGLLLCRGDITHSQRFALFLIAEKKNASVKDVAGALQVTSSACTQLINELVKSGYVQRNINKEDRRELNLVISKKGQTKIALMKKEYFAMMESLFKTLTDAELNTFSTIHKKIITNITV